MAVIGLQFDKVSFERLAPIKGRVTVNNNVKLNDVVKAEVNKRDALQFSFEFTVSYEPKVANMKLEGVVTVFAKPELVKEEAESWKKDKKVSNDLMTEVLNNVLAKGNLAALTFAREVNLPPPIDLPKVKVK